MNKELEEAIIMIKEIITHKEDFDYAFGTKIQRPYAVGHEGIRAIETVLNYIEILETATNNKYPYVIGGRTLYSRLQQIDKEDLIKAYLRLRNETEQLIKEIRNSIPNEVIKEKMYIESNKAVASDKSPFCGKREVDWHKAKVQACEELLEGK